MYEHYYVRTSLIVVSYWWRIYSWYYIPPFRVSPSKQNKHSRRKFLAKLSFRGFEPPTILHLRKQQAEEYRLEAKRLAHALTAATGGVGGRGRLSPGFTAFRPQSSATDGPADDIATGVGEREEEPRKTVVPTRVASIAGGLCPRAAPPPSQQLVKYSTEGYVDREVSQTRRLSSNGNNTGWAFATRGGGKGGRQLQPSLAWESTIGATVESAAPSCYGATRERYEPRDPQLVPRLSNVLDSLGAGLMGLQLPADTAGATTERDGSARRAGRTSSPKSRTGRGSARVELPGNWSPGRSHALRGEITPPLPAQTRSDALRCVS